jgi:hypothetical protein
MSRDYYIYAKGYENFIWDQNEVLDGTGYSGFGSTACPAVALAAALSIKQGKEVTPLSIMENQWRGGQLSEWGDYVDSEILSVSKDDQMDYIKQALIQGDPIIVVVEGINAPTHFVTVVGTTSYNLNDATFDSLVIVDSAGGRLMTMADGKHGNGYEPYFYATNTRSGYRLIYPYDIEVDEYGKLTPITDNKLEKYDGGDYYYPRIAFIQSLIDAIGVPENTAEIEYINDLNERLRIYENANSGEKIQAYFNSIKSLSTQLNSRVEVYTQQYAYSQTVTSPLVLDLDNNDFETKSKQDGIYFDLDNNGFAEKTAWTSGDAFLTYDLNENGKIDNGGELFGNHTLVGESKAADGFAAIAQYDENGDGFIDENDDIYRLIKLWNDDGDGVSEEGEFKTLEEMGVNSIDLNQTAPETINYTDATVSSVSNAEMADGTSRTVADFWFNVSTADTMQIYDGEFDEDILALPDVRSFGKMPSLRVAMQMDESGELKELVTDFMASRDFDERDVLTKQILYKMTGSDALSSISGHITPRDLHTLQTILGTNYYVYGRNPGPNASGVLTDIFNDFARTYSVLLSYDLISNYLNLIDFTEKNGTVEFDPSLFNLYIDLNTKQGNDVEFVLRNVAEYLFTINNDGESYYRFVNHYIDISLDNKKYFDFSDSYLFGTDGDDTINDPAGDAKYFLGKGNDTIKGGYGNETYIFNLGDGNDTITDYTAYSDVKSNRIVFGEGIDTDDLIFSKDGSNLKIAIAGTDDTITVNNHFNNQYYRIENFQTADNSLLSYTNIDYLIQAMAEFSADTGMTAAEAAQENNQAYCDIVNQMWVSQTTA